MDYLKQLGDKLKAMQPIVEGLPTIAEKLANDLEKASVKEADKAKLEELKKQAAEDLPKALEDMNNGIKNAKDLYDKATK